MCWTNNKRWIELTYYCCYSILWLWGFKLVDRLNKMFIFIQNIELHRIDFVVWSQKNFERGLWLWISLWQDCFNRKRYSLRFTLDLNHNFRKFLWIEFKSNAESFLIIMCKDFSKFRKFQVQLRICCFFQNTKCSSCSYEMLLCDSDYISRCIIR